MELRRTLGLRGWKTSTNLTFSTAIGGRHAFACFSCRKSFKHSPDANPLCSGCRSPLHYMGWSFKAPPRKDAEQWLKVQTLYAQGVRFISRGYGEYPALPERLRDVEGFLEAHPDHPLRVANVAPQLLP